MHARRCRLALNQLRGLRRVTWPRKRRRQKRQRRQRRPRRRSKPFGRKHRDIRIASDRPLRLSTTGRPQQYPPNQQSDRTVYRSLLYNGSVFTFANRPHARRAQTTIGGRGTVRSAEPDRHPASAIRAVRKRGGR